MLIDEAKTMQNSYPLTRRDFVSSASLLAIGLAFLDHPTAVGRVEFGRAHIRLRRRQAFRCPGRGNASSTRRTHCPKLDVMEDSSSLLKYHDAELYLRREILCNNDL